MKTKITILSMMVSSFFVVNSLSAQAMDGSGPGNSNATPNGPNEKIAVCHLPSGNPENCQQIILTEVTSKAHLAHGDKLYCFEIAKYPHYMHLVDHDPSKIIIMFDNTNTMW